jgi:hypothetical protein
MSEVRYRIDSRWFATVRTDTQAQLREYTDLRVRASTVPLDDRAAMGQMCTQAGQAQARLWSRAREAADLDRPRRGLIQVDHASLFELQSSLQRGAAHRLPR